MAREKERSENTKRDDIKESDGRRERGRESITFLKSSQSPPARPYHGNSMKINTLEYWELVA
jgi:hypothetical protein